MMLTNFISDPVNYLVVDRYKSVYERYEKDGIIDIDHRLKDKFNFFIYRLEDVVPLVNNMLPPTRQTPYWIAFVKKGKGEKSIGLVNFDIKDYTLFIVPKRIMHSSKYWQGETSGYVMSFNIDFFLNKNFPKQCITNKRALQCSSRPYLYVEGADRGILTAVFEDIVQEFQANPSEHNEMLQIKTLELLIICDRLFQLSNEEKQEACSHPIVEKFTELVERNFCVNRSVHFYADSLFVHPNHLNFLLKKYNGVNAKECINNRIMLESKCLLACTDLIIKEIAFKVGFDDANNFSTFFQKNAGQSPVCYRLDCQKYNEFAGNCQLRKDDDLSFNRL